MPKALLPQYALMHCDTPTNMMSAGGQPLKCLIGPSEWSSDSAALAALTKNPSHVSHVDEFGKFLKKVCGEGASGHLESVKTVLLQAFSRANGIYTGKGYADNKERPVTSIKEPNLCVYGASTPEEIFSALDGGALTDGFLNRFLFVFTSTRPRSKMINITNDAYRDRQTQITKMMQYLEETTRPGLPASPDVAIKTNCRVVDYTEDAAILAQEIKDEEEDTMDLLDKLKDPMVNMWVRYAAHVNKLALIRCISEDPSGRIRKRDLEWAREFVTWSIKRTIEHCVGHVADSKHEGELNKVFAVIKSGEACAARRHPDAAGGVWSCHALERR